MKRVSTRGKLFIVTSALLLLQGTVQSATTIQELGEALYFDQNLSLNGNQSCASCHDPATGFVDPENVADPEASPVSGGSDGVSTGGLNTPSAAYAAFSPFFHWDDAEGLYVGGQFWNGRANTLAEQAAGPFLNPLEMAMPNKCAVVERLKNSNAPNYRRMFRDLYGIKLRNIEDCPKNDNAPPPPGVLEVYDRLAKAIGEFEKTELFNKFDSKYDYYLAGATELTNEEKRGLRLFNGKAKCALCHLPDPSQGPDGDIPPLFTDFTYDNLGVPQNVNIPGQVDPGLGGRDIPGADAQKGKHKVMGLRNIELTAPYAHNGVFTTLEEIVHFYNTRDVLDVCANNNDDEFGDTCWPAPEVPENVNDEELGDLGLTPRQEARIVAFLKTLTDGWGLANGRDPLPRPTMPPMP